MYTYDDFDQKFVEQRSAEFRKQVEKRLSGNLSEDEFKPLRLMNGVYLQLHAYMLRVAIPYGVVSSDQMRMLAHLADKYDKGYGHFTTRQNIQYNWPKLSDIPDMLDKLAHVQMHAIQTSGNCIRNVTSDAFAGVAGDEWIDPRPTAELLRQWSSLHPEFAYLPRKFKFAVIGAAEDRAAMKFHDIGLSVSPDEKGQPIYDVWVGGGQGRTPRVAKLFQTGVQLNDLMPLLDSMLRVYNLLGRRDNKYKARMKILVEEYGIEAYRRDVEADLALQSRTPFEIVEQEYARIETSLLRPEIQPVDGRVDWANQSQSFKNWANKNISNHKMAGYAVASISLKPKGGIPGDASSEQMRAIADIADTYSKSEIRVTHRQNLVLPYVGNSDLPHLFKALVEVGLAEDNIGHASDIIACPGLDYCALATARSIPVAQALSTRLRKREETENLSNITMNISGCINACGHHHAANIGILGLNRNEQEYYQITLGGRSDSAASVSDILGPGFSFDEVPNAVDRIIDFYVQKKQEEESFSDAYSRLGKQAFKEAVYVAA